MWECGISFSTSYDRNCLAGQWKACQNIEFLVHCCPTLAEKEQQGQKFKQKNKKKVTGFSKIGDVQDLIDQ